jgi:Bacterial Ig domain
VAHALTWTDNLGGDVNIALYRNGAYSASIASNTPSDGEYLWTPDPTLALGTGYTVRVMSVTGPTLFDVSDESFTLIAADLVALDDFALISMNTPVPIDVLSNDLGSNGDPMTITALGLPTNGTASIVGSQLVYTPTLGFLGTDVFTYTVSTSTEDANAQVNVVVATEVSRLFLPLIQR